jgi:hypothetical protein
MSTLIIGLILGIGLFFAAKKAFADLRAGKCAGCKSNCSGQKTSAKPLSVQLELTPRKK